VFKDKGRVMKYCDNDSSENLLQGLLSFPDNLG